MAINGSKCSKVSDTDFVLIVNQKQSQKRASPRIENNNISVKIVIIDS